MNSTENKPERSSGLPGWLASAFRIFAAALLVLIILAIAIPPTHSPDHRQVVNEMAVRSLMGKLRNSLEAFQDKCEGFPIDLKQLVSSQPDIVADCQPGKESLMGLKKESNKEDYWASHYDLLHEYLLRDNKEVGFVGYRCTYKAVGKTAHKQNLSIAEHYSVICAPTMYGVTGNYYYSVADTDYMRYNRNPPQSQADDTIFDERVPSSLENRPTYRQGKWLGVF